jgi:hypothetical protein
LNDGNEVANEVGQLGVEPVGAGVEENTAADGVELSVEQIARLNDLTPASGERHDEGRWERFPRNQAVRGNHDLLGRSGTRSPIASSYGFELG